MNIKQHLLSEISPELYDLHKIFPKQLNCNSIYLRGDPNTFRRSGLRLGIVGTRKSTQYGRRVVSELLRMLRGHPICIVSGGAIGIDACAQNEALNNQLDTRAWLVGPIARPGPQHNSELFRKIESAMGSALIVPTILEEPEGLRKKLGNRAWLLRNAWIAADSDVVLVVEAFEKSGTWQTVKDAADMGKPVFLLPGSIFNESSRGVSLMISRGHGEILTDLKRFAESLVVCATRKLYNIDKGLAPEVRERVPD